VIRENNQARNCRQQDRDDPLEKARALHETPHTVPYARTWAKVREGEEFMWDELRFVMEPARPRAGEGELEVCTQ
jgi:hypothetical protein